MGPRPHLAQKGGHMCLKCPLDLPMKPVSEKVEGIVILNRASSIDKHAQKAKNLPVPAVARVFPKK